METAKKHSLLHAFASPQKPKKGRFTHILQASPSKTQNNSLLLHDAKVSNSTDLAVMKSPKKVCYFNDPIHGNISMSGLCLEIIDTKEFQRLRDLKQLGTCDFVYPGATHTRFSHSIGVAYYAEKVVRTLVKHQPELGITEEDILCVKVAGLCHDLGHGPFSHVFDGVFMTRMHPKKKLRHEDWSVNIFNYLLEKNQININSYGLDEKDRLFIAEIISGVAEGERQGRPAQKFYLYDIVNNSRSGLDVDKLDYFQRDIHHTNVDTNYNHFQRFFEFGRVLRAEPIHSSPSTSNVPFYLEIASPIAERPSNLSCAYMVCYPEKMVGEALQLFALRYQLHQKVYTHKSIKKVEYMLVDALELADPHILIPGSKTESHPSGQYRMSECYLDPAAMCNLKDSVIYLIEISTTPELEEARKILERIRRRQFVSCC